MAVTVRSFDEVSRLISRNPLRNFPNQNKGRDRLFPVPRPRISTSRTIDQDAGFFSIGACFARGVEKALMSAGRRVLSSQTGLGLPGSVEEQFNRYNVFNLDVGMNEVRWALGVHDAPWDAPLVRVGEFYTDLQLHWAFAHPEDEARAFRKLYNDSFKPIREADVIVLSVAGRRQWFDRENGIYINTTPTPALVRAYPDRFEMHEFDVDGCADRLEAAIGVIRDTCPRNPLIMVAVAPVWQPISLTAGDSLLDQLVVKATQRLAVERICQTCDGVEYLPALENAMLGDFAQGFVENSPNHTSLILAERVVADFLQDYGATDQDHALLLAKAHGTAALIGRDAERAIMLCETLAEAMPNDPDFASMFARALLQAGQKQRAVQFLLDQIEANPGPRAERIWHLAVGMIGSNDVEHEARARQLGERIGADLRYMDQRRSAPSDEAKTIRRALADAAAALSSGDAARARDLLRDLRPLRGRMLPLGREKYDLLVLRTASKAGDNDAGVEEVIGAMYEDESPSPKVFLQLCGALKVNADNSQFKLADALEELAERRFTQAQCEDGPVHSGLGRLMTLRRKSQIRAAGPKHHPGKNLDA